MRLRGKPGFCYFSIIHLFMELYSIVLWRENGYATYSNVILVVSGTEGKQLLVDVRVDSGCVPHMCSSNVPPLLK